MNVLIIGGAGHVGSTIRPALEAQHHCRYFDLKPVPGAEERSIVGDVNDDAAVERAVAGVDAIVYLAMGYGPTGDRASCGHLDGAFNVNARGWYRIMHHALQTGVRRFVYASTLSVYWRLYSDAHPVIDESIPPNAWEPYGLSKRIGELVCQAAVQRWPDATVLALRLMFPLNDNDVAGMTQENKKRWSRYPLLPNDTRRLFLAALACDKPGCHIVQATGDCENKHYPNALATQITGWRPEGK